MALNFQQGICMRETARSNKRVLMVGHLLEYHSAIRELREIMEQGVLGEVNYIYSNRLNFGKIRTEENALWSFTPHDIAIILRLIEECLLEVTCFGGSYITSNLADVTVSGRHFWTGLHAQIFGSWLNLFKEQNLVVVDDEKMAVFNDLEEKDKLILYDQRVSVACRRPILERGAPEIVKLSGEEPLRNECSPFLECVRERRDPLTDADCGIQVLKVLQACHVSLQLNGRPTLLHDVN